MVDRFNTFSLSAAELFWRLVVRSRVVRSPFSGTSSKTSDSRLRGREGRLDELVELELLVMVVFSCLGTWYGER